MLINFSQLKSALLTGLCCGTFCVGTLVLQTTVCNPAVGQDALGTLQEPSKPAAQQNQNQGQGQQQDAAMKQNSEMLFKELEKLVPGEQAEGAPDTEALYTAVDSFMQRRPDMSLEILQRAAASNPQFPPAELLMAGLFFASKNQNTGIKFLQKAAMENPQHPAVYAAYGRLASASRRIVDAKVHFEKLLALLDQVKDETAIKHYENEYLEGMSQTAVQLKDFDLARNLIGKVLERQPDSLNSLRLLARVDFDEGKLDEAVANLTKLREKVPETRVPEAVIGSWFAKENKMAEAAKWIEKLPTSYPTDAAVQREYAAWALTQEDIPGAAAAIARAEAIEPLPPAAKNVKGKVAFYQRKYDDAVAIYKELNADGKAHNPEFANMYVLSLIESSSPENKALANELANVNRRLDPTNRVTLAAQGYVRLRTLGVNEELKQIFGRIVQTRRDGRSPEVDFFLANFLKEIGENKNALAILQQASKYPALFLYRNQADQMKQALSATVGPTGTLPTSP